MSKIIKGKPITKAERRRLVRLAKKIIENFETFGETKEAEATTPEWWRECLDSNDQISWLLMNRHPAREDK